MSAIIDQVTREEQVLSFSVFSQCIILYYTILHDIILYRIISYYTILYHTIIYCIVLSYTIMYSVLLSDGMTTSFTCATHLQSINRGYPHPLLPFDRGWPPPKLITECGYPHLPYSVWRIVGHLLSLK